jgi:hypothetical protein
MLFDFRLVHECQSQTRFSSASLAHENCMGLIRLGKHLDKLRKLAVAAVKYLGPRGKVDGFIRSLGYLQSSQ